MSVGRISAGSMILAERRTRKSLLASVGVGVGLAIADLGRLSRWRPAAVLSALAAAAHVIVSHARDAIADGRLDARNVSRKRLGVELAAAAAIAGGTSVVSRYSAPPEDALRAEMAATSLASAWRGMAYAEAAKAARRDRSISAALDRSGTLAASRADRIAQVEIAQAYNDEHRTALYEMRDDLVDVVLRRWDASGDRRMCDHCAHHDGEEIEVDGEFGGGDLPGEMHVGCRCVEVVISAMRRRSAA